MKVRSPTYPPNRITASLPSAIVCVICGQVGRVGQVRRVGWEPNPFAYLRDLRHLRPTCVICGYGDLRHLVRREAARSLWDERSPPL